jgi:16S rRNA processing protein RimM
VADAPQLLEVGHVGKAHGLAGQVHVRLTSNVTERLAAGSELTAATTPPRQLRVGAARQHGDRWVVTFDGVGDREAAEALRGVALLAPPIDDDPDALWVHELIGAEVVDVGGRSHGRVAAVIDNPASDLLELEGGALVPLTFVVSHDADRIVVDPPAGLLDDESEP